MDGTRLYILLSVGLREDPAVKSACVPGRGLKFSSQNLHCAPHNVQLQVIQHPEPHTHEHTHTEKKMHTNTQIKIK